MSDDPTTPAPDLEALARPRRRVRAVAPEAMGAEERLATEAANDLSPVLGLLEAALRDPATGLLIDVRRYALRALIAAARERDDLRAEVARLTAERDNYRRILVGLCERRGVDFNAIERDAAALEAWIEEQRHR